MTPEDRAAAVVRVRALRADGAVVDYEIDVGGVPYGGTPSKDEAGRCAAMISEPIAAAIHAAEQAAAAREREACAVLVQAMRVMARVEMEHSTLELVDRTSAAEQIRARGAR